MTQRPTVLRDTLWRERTHPPAPGNNLPSPPTDLIGRDSEREMAVSLLGQPSMRHLTMYGPGGVGKTRLALAVAADLAESFPDGVYFVNLQDVSESGLFLSAISQALELYTLPDETILPTLIGHMRDMGALLVLDNFEQLTGAAPVLAELLSACPRLKALVTSRTILNLRGEQALEIRPLPLPTPGGKTNSEAYLAAVESSPAVQMFMERARSVKPSFALTVENAGEIAEICARLDGLPLALELAAARVKLLSPKALLARLQKRLQVLTGGAQDLPARQQTLQNAIHWSYDLLTPLEQRLFRLISVFSGGCTLDAVEAVCAGVVERLPAERASAYEELDALELITSLANKSLLRVVENDDDEVRVQMLETVREFALEQLQANHEGEEARAAHAHYFVAYIEGAEPELRGPGQVLWLGRLERDMGNIRAAIDWALAAGEGVQDADRLEAGLRIAGGGSRFWQVRSHQQEAFRWLESLLARTTNMRTRARAQALRTAGRIASLVVNHHRGRALYEEALGLARELDDLPGIALALNGVGGSLWGENDVENALQAFEECLRIWTETGSKSGVAGALNNIGIMKMSARDPAGVGYLERSVEVYRQIGDEARLGVTLGSLGRARLRSGDIDGAERDIREGARIALEIVDHWHTAYSIGLLADVATTRKDYKNAVRLFAAAEATYDGYYDRLDHYDRRMSDMQLDRLRRVLGDREFDELWAAGLQLTPAQAFAPQEESQQVLLPVANPARPQEEVKAPVKAAWSNSEGLSVREIEVLQWLAQGLSNAEIAEKLYLSLYTVNAHLRNIYSKVNVSSRSAARRFAVDSGLI